MTGERGILPWMEFLGKKVAGAVFDMDGLLLDTERISLRAWQAGAAAVGVEMPDSMFLDMIGRRHEDCRAVLVRHAGRALDLEAISRAMYADYERRLTTGVPVMAGARELLSKLHASGLPLGVATSTRTELARRKLAKAGLLDFFRSVTGGDGVARGKPAPDIYLAAAEALGVPSHECAAFEDSPPGALSAVAAGMRVALVPDMVRPAPEVVMAVSVVLPSLVDALGLFSEL
ncbi:MAG: HAD family phosphatase [Puniceicoccales bacterium]|jgi:HAD superfamily hydrolase (TIGR01509 family)|nr:HAD family phosphatase [Puniceicoccales bacterium]